MAKSNKRDLIEEFSKRFSENDLDDFVIDLKCAEAAFINNGGVESQLEFIIDQHGSEARKVLEGLLK